MVKTSVLSTLGEKPRGFELLNVCKKNGVAFIVTPGRTNHAKWHDDLFRHLDTLDTLGLEGEIKEFMYEPYPVDTVVHSGLVSDYLRYTFPVAQPIGGQISVWLAD